MTIINIDIETRSACDLLAAGGMKYAEDPTTEILCYAYKIDDQPAVSVICYPDIADGFPPRDLQDAILAGATIRGWNIAGFDVPVWNNTYGGPAYISPEQIDDTMDRARAVGVPARLANAARFMDLDIHKDMEGHQLMKRLCRASAPEPTDEELDRLSEYCRMDVEVEALLAKRLPPLPSFEIPVMRLSHEINQRGFLVDLDLCHQAVAFAVKENNELSKRLEELTDGIVTRHTQRGRILNFVNDMGAKLPNLQRQTLEDAVENPADYDPAVVEILEIRLSGAKASTAKFQAAINMAGRDGRVRGTFVYYGASATGRWSGRGIQPHNLPRETADDPYTVVADIQSGQVKSVYKALSTLLRPMIMAPKGKSLVRCDYSAIEGRVVAWLADDKPALREYKGAGRLYERAAAGIYGVPIDKVTKAQRQVGKVAELALGFQGGHMAFASMAKNYGVKVSEVEARGIVSKWRESRPAVVSLWEEVETAAVRAFHKKNREITCCKGKVSFIFDEETENLWIKLPAGRFICLPAFRVDLKEGPFGTTDRLSYKRGNWTPAQGAPEWPRADTYGGSLVESLAQGIARDLLAFSMLHLGHDDYDIVMHVHDEIVVESPDALADKCLSHMKAIMSVTPGWAKGLPLSAEGEISKRFGK
jgi:DNA polymerase